jgi:hypothetical protein
MLFYILQKRFLTEFFFRLLPQNFISLCRCLCWFQLGILEDCHDTDNRNLEYTEIKWHVGLLSYVMKITKAREERRGHADNHVQISHIK